AGDGAGHPPARPGRQIKPTVADADYACHRRGGRRLADRRHVRPAAARRRAAPTRQPAVEPAAIFVAEFVRIPLSPLPEFSRIPLRKLIRRSLITSRRDYGHRAWPDRAGRLLAGAVPAALNPHSPRTSQRRPG